MKRNFWTLVWLLVVGWPAIYGQTIPIEGVVLDSITRQPLPGATVVVRPAERGTTTDGGGRFTLSVPVLPQRLSISYVGYGPVELELNERPADPLLIVLRPEATELEQVVVSPDNQPLPLSDGDEYVVVDFALTGE
ncbi:MAG: carboxypeptidase-like regulatory domain-containing protein, partial [Saprospiraceae bacterium]|nr:carboxypeptidase-like regulatory domain-containing protein [Saprospiraceae bacterium]